MRPRAINGERILDDSAEVKRIVAERRGSELQQEYEARWPSLLGSYNALKVAVPAVHSNPKHTTQQPTPEESRRPRDASGMSRNGPPQPNMRDGGEGELVCSTVRVSPSPVSPVAGVPPTRDHSILRDSSRGNESSDDEYKPLEVVVDKNGLPRQAGAVSAEGEWIKRYRMRAEQNLYVFNKGVLGRNFLTPHFHREVCKFVQRCPPFRKLVLMPREHAKTAIVSGGLPVHILIQPVESNIYFPGLDGSECRILLAGETANMAEKNLRVVKSVFEENRLFRAFWPQRVWENIKDSKQWNSNGIIIPRKNEWPDPSIRAIGVGGAVTGARPNVIIKDDLTTFDAANSETIMLEAIEWHKASRALLDKYEIESGLQSLEFIIGTRWAVYDLYSEIIDNDPSVEVIDMKYHRIIRDGNILWPEKYSMRDIEQLQREHGSNFYLLYLNSVADPELTDFDMSLVRSFTIADNCVVFDADERDAILGKKQEAKKAKAEGIVPVTGIKPGMRLNAYLLQRMAEASGGIRLRAA